jgi:methylated-DNA-protein-cysteine methyltransferase-like protein
VASTHKKSAPARQKKKSTSVGKAQRAPAKKVAVLALPPRPARPPRTAREPAIEARTVSWWDDFYRVVRLIPRGRVTTYGVVAELGGHPRSARHVGFAMAALKDTRKHRDVPWQRVLGASPGRRAHVTIRDPLGGAMQRAILEKEGVTFDARGRIELDRFGWPDPGPVAPRAARISARSSPGR